MFRISSHIIFLAYFKIVEPCMSHSECISMDLFCSRIKCQNKTGSCSGVCKPGVQCYCNSDSIDGRCPFPHHSSRSVRYLQGQFQSSVSIGRALGYDCIRKLTVTGQVFSLLQYPMFTSHPATTKRWDSKIFADCLGTATFGALRGVEITNASQILFVTLSSEGDLICLNHWTSHRISY